MLKRVERLQVEYAHRKRYLQVEVKHALLKSLIQDHNNDSRYKIIYHKKLRTEMRVIGFSKQRSACALTGRSKGLVRFLGLSRQSVKRCALLNKLQNIRVGS